MSVPEQVCVEEGCVRPVKGRGICAAHMEKERRRRKGPPKHIFGERKPCAAEGCDRLSYTPGTEHCHKHYVRLRRHGTLVPKIVRGERGPCQAEGCPDVVATPGIAYCNKHDLRVRKHGDPSIVLPSGTWKGEDAGYQAAHRRVHVQHGKAVDHACVDCAGPAAQWSYDHTDPDERVCPEDGPYSFDTGRYQPRCISCHTRFDKGLSRPVVPRRPAS